MDTAKVDIQKLQLLNDRINQTIDALNQVRSSVHALQSATPSMGGIPWQGLMHTPASLGIGGAVGQGQFAGYGQGQMPGAVAQQQGAVQPSFGPQNWPQQHAGFAGQAMGMGQGLSHSPLQGSIQGAVGGYIDPLVLSRVAQTFPYAFSPTPGIRY